MGSSRFVYSTTFGAPSVTCPPVNSNSPRQRSVLPLSTAMASRTIRSGSSCPTDSTLKRKWSASRRSSTRVAKASACAETSDSGSHCLQKTHARGLAAAVPPPSKTDAGRATANGGAAGPALTSTTGFMRYDAVATGENLAWSRATPLRPCASNDKAWPGRSFARRMSAWTGLTGRSARNASCSPCGSHFKSDEKTFVVKRGPPSAYSSASSSSWCGAGSPGSRCATRADGTRVARRFGGARTSSPKTMVLASVASSWSSSKSCGSAAMGTSPNRCARTSSWMTPSFSST
mmetsp:Transcript_25138/g.77504  ORF Transcript_25138/g.77504 Transcript_25138/m.77504 type:complete len:290 (+) Transcript_25138:57-926(+)